jgi:hypothetical protein
VVPVLYYGERTRTGYRGRKSVIWFGLIWRRSLKGMMNASKVFRILLYSLRSYRVAFPCTLPGLTHLGIILWCAVVWFFYMTSVITDTHTHTHTGTCEFKDVSPRIRYAVDFPPFSPRWRNSSVKRYWMIGWLDDFSSIRGSITFYHFLGPVGLEGTIF